MSAPARTLWDDDPTPSRPDRCPHCGQTIKKLNRHRMDFAKWVMLRKIVDIAGPGREWVKVQRDGALIRDDEHTIQGDDVHALRLFWFGLVERMARRSGMYRPTEHGRLFLAGLASVPASILCRGGVVERTSGERVRVGDIKGVVLDKAYWDRYGQSEQESAA